MSKIFSILLALSFGLAAVKGATFLFIGDSITDGNWGSPSGYPCPTSGRNHNDLNHILGHGYVEMTAGYLMGEYPGRGYKFINRGISGETLSQIACRWEEDVVSLNPDTVSLLCGTNDVHYWLETEPTELSSFDFNGYRNRLDSIINITAMQLPETGIVLATPFVAKSGWVGEDSRFALRRNAVDSVAIITREIAALYPDRVSLVDFNLLLSTLLEENPDPAYWVWDGIHPTTAMHYRMSRLWLTGH